MKRKIHALHNALDESMVKKRSFEQLPSNLLVAGELEIILTKKISDRERKARLAVLRTLSYHAEYLGLQDIKDQYCATMRKIETRQCKWSLNMAQKRIRHCNLGQPVLTNRR